MESIEQLNLLKKATNQRLSEINSKIHEYWLAKYKEEYGVEKGSAVILDDGRKGVVTHIEVCTYDPDRKPWTKGFVENKSGKMGKKEQQFYQEWLVEAPQE